MALAPAQRVSIFARAGTVTIVAPVQDGFGVNQPDVALHHPNRNPNTKGLLDSPAVSRCVGAVVHLVCSLLAHLPARVSSVRRVTWKMGIGNMILLFLGPNYLLALVGATGRSSI